MIGAMRPGQPFQVRATVRSDFDTPDAELRVTLPDLEDVAATARRQRLGIPLAPKAGWRGALKKGQLLTQTATITVPAPGYYRIRVAVRAPTADDLLPDGSGVQNFNLHEEWLLVCQQGGRATGEWGSVFVGPAGGGLAPGRFQGVECADPTAAVPRVRVVAASTSTMLVEECDPQILDPSDCDPVDPPPPPPPSAQLSGQVVYLNYADSINVPLPQARVRGKTINGTWSTPWTTAGNNGDFVIDCPPAGVTTAQIEVFSENNDVVVKDTDSARTNNYVPHAAVAYMNISSATCPSPVAIIVTSPRQAELFHNHIVAIDRSRAVFGQAGTLPKLNVVIKRPYHINPRTGTWGTEKPAGTMVDSITYREEDATGTWAQFAVPHEIGHAAHHRNLGGITGFRRVNNCLGHDLVDPNSMGCAAVEGFATFWAVLARWPTPPGGPGGRVHSIYDYLSHNRFLYNGGSAPRDGSRLSGAVASFLLDVVDGIGMDTVAGLPPFQDGLQLSPGLVTGVVRDCKIFTYFSPYPQSLSNNAVVRADGVDHWAYCLEQEMRRADIYTYTIDDCGGASGLACSGYNHTVTWDNSFYPGIPDTYFAQRRTDSSPQYPRAWQMGSNGPDRNIPPRPDVRRLWLCNLYGQRCASGSVAAPFP